MVAGRGSLLATFKNQPLSCVLRCTLGVRVGSFSSDRPAPDALGMSASLRSRPNLRTAANRRGVPIGDSCAAAKSILVRSPRHFKLTSARMVSSQHSGQREPTQRRAGLITDY